MASGIDIAGLYQRDLPANPHLQQQMSDPRDPKAGGGYDPTGSRGGQHVASAAAAQAQAAYQARSQAPGSQHAQSRQQQQRPQSAAERRQATQPLQAPPPGPGGRVAAARPKDNLGEIMGGYDGRDSYIGSSMSFTHASHHVFDDHRALNKWRHTPAAAAPAPETLAPAFAPTTTPAPAPESHLLQRRQPEE